MCGRVEKYCIRISPFTALCSYGLQLHVRVTQGTHTNTNTCIAHRLDLIWCTTLNEREGEKASEKLKRNLRCERKNLTESERKRDNRVVLQEERESLRYLISSSCQFLILNNLLKQLLVPAINTAAHCAAHCAGWRMEWCMWASVSHWFWSFTKNRSHLPWPASSHFDFEISGKEKCQSFVSHYPQNAT